MVPIIVRLSLATLSAIVGGLLAAGLRQRASERMLPLVFIALGTLLSVTIFDVLPDAKQGLDWSVFLIAVGSGYLVFWLISRYLYSICPACAFAQTSSELNGSACDSSGIKPEAKWPAAVEDVAVDVNDPAVARARALIWLLTAALAVHCTVDGLAIVVGDDLVRGLDLAVLIAVIVHKLPEGMALALYLMSAGQRASKAVLWTTAVEMATLVGGLAGAQLLTAHSVFWLSLLFAHVGGGFLYLVVTTVGGLRDGQSRSTRPIVIGGGVAFTITSVLLLSLRG